MTIDGALNDLNNLLKADDIPIYYKPSIKAVMETITMEIKPMPQEQCEDCIRRSDIGLTDFEIVMCNGDYKEGLKMLLDKIEKAPSVTPQPEVGRWIYDKNIDNWKCSECGETPKTMGYCGSADFMAKHFKYCNHCGAKMQEVEDG